MARGERRHLPEEAVEGQAGGEQRKVEAAAVVGDHARQRGEVARDQAQQGRLVRVVGEEQLSDDELLALEAAEPRQEDDGPGTGREAGRLGVEVAGRRKLGQAGDGCGRQADPPLDDDRGAVRRNLEPRPEPAGEDLGSLAG